MHKRHWALINLYLIRVMIIIVWLGLIALFLYSPYLKYFWTPSNSLNVYTWADMFDVSDAREFETQTGIKVNLVYYDNSEELVAKLTINGGRGYDVLILGDSYVQDFVKLDLLAPIDKTKLNFWQELAPDLLNAPYDPHNIYSLPYSWDVYGIGINLEKFNHRMPQKSWQLIFDPKLGVTNIGMMEEALRVVAIAAQYLYGNIDQLDHDQMTAVKNLLIAQKKMVTVYTELLGDYLLFSGTSPVVVSQAAYVGRIMKIKLK